MDRVSGVFILVRHPYELNGGQPRGHAEGYIPGMKWIDGSKIISIEPLTPPPVIGFTNVVIEHCMQITYESGQCDEIAEPADSLMALCNEAKKNAEGMRLKLIEAHRNGGT